MNSTTLVISIFAVLFITSGGKLYLIAKMRNNQKLIATSAEYILKCSKKSWVK